MSNEEELAYRSELTVLDTLLFMSETLPDALRIDVAARLRAPERTTISSRRTSWLRNENAATIESPDSVIPGYDLLRRYGSMGASPLQAHLESQIVRLDHFIALLQSISEASAVPNDASVRSTILHASVIKVINSGMAVRVLANAECVEEILSIGRTMVEVSVNAVYLQHASAREFERFLHFHPESAARNVTMLPSPIELPAPDDAFSRFGKKIMRSLPTLPSKRVDPSWSSRSLLERATIADEASNIPVMSLLVRRCYPRGHAAVLGAVDSLGYFIAALHGTADASQESRTVALTEAVFGVNLCLFTLAFYLSAFFRLNLDRAIEQAAHAEPSSAHRSILGVDPSR